MSLIERYDGELADLRAYAEVVPDQLRRHNRELSERAAEVESLRQQLRGAVDRLTTMNECVRIFLNHDGKVRPGWLEEEVSMTDDFLRGQ